MSVEVRLLLWFLPWFWFLDLVLDLREGVSRVGDRDAPERLLCSSMCRAFILHTASRLRDSAHGTAPSGQYSGSLS